MPSYFTSSSLIADIKRRAMIPTSQSTFSDDDFLAFANEELAIGLLPSIMMYHEEYYVWAEDVPLVSNKSKYNIPYRAVGGKLRNLQYRNSLDTNLTEMTRIDPDDAPYFFSQSGINFYGRFFLEGNNIVIVPSITIAPVGNLVFSYYLRPNQLVKETRVSLVTAIDLVNGIISVDKTPTNIVSGNSIDFLETRPGHRTRKFDITIQSIDTTNKTITFAPSDIPEDLAIGDCIALAGECIVPQVPDELQVVLSQRVAARCLEALGDAQGLNNANTKLQEMELKTGMLIDNRVEGSPKKINNIRGSLRAAKIRRRTYL